MYLGWDRIEQPKSILVLSPLRDKKNLHGMRQAGVKMISLILTKRFHLAKMINI